MHPHKVTLDGCYHPASTVRNGDRCYEDVECMGSSECYSFVIPKTIAPQGYGRNQKHFNKSSKLCAPEDSEKVKSSVPEAVGTTGKRFVTLHRDMSATDYPTIDDDPHNQDYSDASYSATEAVSPPSPSSDATTPTYDGSTRISDDSHVNAPYGK